MTGWSCDRVVITDQKKGLYNHYNAQDTSTLPLSHLLFSMHSYEWSHMCVMVTCADSPEFDHIQPVGKNQIWEKSKYQMTVMLASGPVHSMKARRHNHYYPKA